MSFSRVKTAVGTLALLTSISLGAGGGVDVARADPPARVSQLGPEQRDLLLGRDSAPAETEAASCQAGPGTEHALADLQRVAGRAVAAAAAKEGGEPSAHVVVLNGAGYNYRAPMQPAPRRGSTAPPR